MSSVPVTEGAVPAQELRRRAAILDAARSATERFVDAAGDWRGELDAVLGAFGRAAEVSRVFVSGNLVDERGRLCSRPLAEWDAPGIPRVGDDPQLQAAPPWSDGFARWAEVLGRGETIAGSVHEFPASEQELFVPQGVVATVVVPVHVEGEWWGHVGFDECTRERTWSDAELDALRTAAAILALAVRLERSISARAAALDLLERRVSALGRVAGCLVVDQPLEQTLREVARLVVDAGSGVAAALHVVDQSSGELTLLAVYGTPEGAELSFPLDSLGRSLGALRVYRPAGPDPEPDELAFLAAVADQTAAAVENARLLADGRLTAALRERQRLARDLHDSVSQALFSMTLHARTAQLALQKAELPADGPLARSVGQLRELTQGALAEMRALIFELRPGALAEEGLVVAVTKQAAAISAREGLPITVTGPEERLPVPAETEEHLYRIVLEALHNAVKHARAQGIAVRVTSDGVLIEDDGAGFDPTADRPGHLGLGTMRDRAAAVGAVLTLDSAPGHGTRVAVSLGGTA